MNEMNVMEVDVQGLNRLLKEQPGVEVWDVREPSEFRREHIAEARLMPWSGMKVETCVGLRSGKAGERLYLVCESGGRAGRVAKMLRDAGCEDGVVVAGGMGAWRAAGLPVIRGVSAWSLERQVRFAAGLLVTLGVGLGGWVGPGFLVLSAFVGVGLMFAAVTNTCGMALLLAKMPWNRVSTECKSGGSCMLGGSR